MSKDKAINYDNLKNYLDDTWLQLPQSYTSIIAYPLTSGVSYGASAETSEPEPSIQAYPREEWGNNFGVKLLQNADSDTDIRGVPYNNRRFNFFNTVDYTARSSRLPYEVVQVLSLEDVSYELDPNELYGARPGDMCQEYSILFTIRKNNDEPAQDTEQATSAENDSNMAVGYISGSDVLDTSRDAYDVYARGWIAPHWESLINNLDHWTIGYIITSLKASDEFKEELRDELKRDQQSLRKRLIKLLENTQ
ncbi:hypothetical protein [Endozoicomonas euniceicola]|uniref:Uncharacterized protein n=1 Tax=Endozoicomonas euniceicola TaxID=1234143 RepID=A0ABY6GMJ4_9GAMM|nr:hypothetical protein [Endozoicomonas euniceicola]UYM13845.1 hypothetical protein NX720_13020 [Endozoicomonas euniceicola]